MAAGYNRVEDWCQQDTIEWRIGSSVIQSTGGFVPAGYNRVEDQIKSNQIKFIGTGYMEVHMGTYTEILIDTVTAFPSLKKLTLIRQITNRSLKLHREADLGRI